MGVGAVVSGVIVVALVAVLAAYFVYSKYATAQEEKIDPTSTHVGDIYNTTASPSSNSPYINPVGRMLSKGAAKPLLDELVGSVVDPVTKTLDEFHVIVHDDAE
jgi:hypothetical protein